MALLYGQQWTKEELLKRVGDIGQLCGAKVYELLDGPARGVVGVDVWTGGGLTFTVLASRGMDIGMARYRGFALAWRSPTTEIHPAFYEPERYGWLRGFHGGLLTTCGLMHAGHPIDDEGVHYGLHGRASYTPASNLKVDGYWEGDDYFIVIEGRIREGAVFSPVLELHRRISVKLGENRLFIRDTVTNIGFQPSPLMLLYHINLGFPILSEHSELVLPSKKVQPRDPDAEAGVNEYMRFSPPQPNFREQVFFHELVGNRDGSTCAAVINRTLMHGEGLGVYVRWNLNELPYFVQWKMMGEGIYVVGIEPTNAPLQFTRTEMRQQGLLPILQPGEQKVFNLEIGVLTNRAEIDQFRQFVTQLMMGR
ncbi:MAG: hypothetical protein SLRJCFUN_001553 [Candidatus Fervidibacter sp.]